MTREYRFQPQNVCSREMILKVHDDHTIESLEVIGGCHGNLQGIAQLIKGRKIEEVASLLKGIACRGSRTKVTSCPDQLAQFLSSLE